MVDTAVRQEMGRVRGSQGTGCKGWPAGLLEDVGHGHHGIGVGRLGSYDRVVWGRLVDSG